MSKLGNIFSSFRARLILFVVIDVIFLANVFFLMSGRVSLPFFSDKADRPTTESVEKTLTSADPKIESINTMLIQGSYRTDDGKTFTFSSDGTFAGYFTSDVPDAEGKYTVSTENGVNTVKIVCDKKSLEYTTSYDDQYNLVLTAGNGKSYTLFDN